MFHKAVRIYGCYTSKFETTLALTRRLYERGFFPGRRSTSPTEPARRNLPPPVGQNPARIFFGKNGTKTVLLTLSDPPGGILTLNNPDRAAKKWLFMT